MISIKKILNSACINTKLGIFSLIVFMLIKITFPCPLTYINIKSMSSQDKSIQQYKRYNHNTKLIIFMFFKLISFFYTIPWHFIRNKYIKYLYNMYTFISYNIQISILGIETSQTCPRTSNSNWNILPVQLLLSILVCKASV